MPAYEDTYKYHSKMGNKVVRTGITYDPERREAEHRKGPGLSKGHIKEVGFRTTREAALAWQQLQTRQGKPRIRGDV